MLPCPMSSCGKRTTSKNCTCGYIFELHNYQREAVEWLRRRGYRGVLALEMGLGKTAIALAALLEIKKDALIVCPAALVSMWETQIKFWLPGISVSTDNKRSVLNFHKDKFKVSIVSFSKLGVAYQPTWHYKGLDSYITPCIVIDEAHHIRNDTKQTNACLYLSEQATSCSCLLTGTPFTNTPSDLYYLLNCAAPKPLFRSAETANDVTWKGAEIPSAARWNSHFFNSQKISTTNGTLTKYLGVQDSKKEEWLRLLDLVMLRRCRADVANQLPEVTSVLHDVGVDTTIKKGVDAALKSWKSAKDMTTALASGDQDAITTALSAAGQAQHKYSVQSANAKFAYVAALIAEARYNQCEPPRFTLIFDHHDVGDHYQSHLEPLRDIGAVGRIDGQTTNRDDVMSKATSGDYDVLLLHFCCCEGLTLTAYSQIIFIELPWTSVAYDQAVARLHRQGQTKPVFLHIYFDLSTKYITFLYLPTYLPHPTLSDLNSTYRYPLSIAIFPNATADLAPLFPPPIFLRSLATARSRFMYPCCKATQWNWQNTSTSQKKERSLLRPCLSAVLRSDPKKKKKMILPTAASREAWVARSLRAEDPQALRKK